jgi:ribosome-associated toxin RatA of RatAB toxin-antitoxin module
MDIRIPRRPRLAAIAALAGASALGVTGPLPDGVSFAQVAEAGTPEPDTVAVPHGDGYSRGRSTITVKAPIEKVRETVLDFPRYPEFMPHYSKCKVLGRTATGARDVYMEVSALHGAVSLWARIEVPKPTTVDGVETYETKYVDGNVKDLKAIWRLKRVDDAQTSLSLEVFLNPKLPLPKRLVNKENLDGSAAAVIAAKGRIERR